MTQTQATPRDHLPTADDFLLWPPSLQAWGYRIVDRLFATRTIPAGTPKPWAYGPELALEVDALMERSVLSGVLVIKDGAIRLERYGLGLRPQDRWSTMSTIKSMTALLIGCAVQDGAIASLDDNVVAYIPSLAGTAYDGVSLRHLLTMSSGTAWQEVYSDPASHVNQYSRAFAQRRPGGVLALMAGLERAHAPGTSFLYNSGDTFLLGSALRAAVGMPLADYMAARIWQPMGMECDGFYSLESEGGQEIAGSRAGMVLRDFGKIAQFVLDDGVIGGRRVLPAGFLDAATTPAFPAADNPRAPGITGYGYSWWLGEGMMSAIGFAGQRIDIFRAERLAVITLGAFPQPPHASEAEEAGRRGAVADFVQAVRRAVG